MSLTMVKNTSVKKISVPYLFTFFILQKWEFMFLVINASDEKKIVKRMFLSNPISVPGRDKNIF